MNDKLLNIGPKSAAWLRQVGVRTHADLSREGALGTFLKVKRAGFKPSLNLLYALAGAEKGCHWTALSADEKATMVLAVNESDAAIKQAKKFVTPARDIVVERAGADDRAEAPEPSGLFDDPAGGGSDASTDHGDGGHGD